MWVKLMSCLFEKEKNEVNDNAESYRLRTQCEKQCTTRVNGQLMREINEMKSLEPILHRYGSVEGWKGKKVVGWLGCMMRGKKVIIDIKKALQDSINVLKLACVCDTWT